ncbi:MAG: hypothetical protein LBU94_01995 [Clostridiales bacterium]|nr:hypothetical protein [Clostridiales bacterium]
MENLNASVIRAFNIDARNIKKSKGCYILSHDNDRYVMRKSQEDMETIIFQHELKEGLFKNGFRNTDRFIESEGLPYVFSEGSFYVLNREIQGREHEF